MKPSHYILSGLVAMAILSAGAIAEPPAKKKELPQSGTLSSTGGGGTAARLAGVWGGDGVTGEKESKSEGAPIVGSVSRSGVSSWKASVQNSSVDTYSADLQVVQIGDRGSVVKTDSFSVTLKPGASYERSFSANAASRQADLKMQGWRKLTHNSEKAEKVAAEAAQN